METGLATMQNKLVYSPVYDFALFGVEKFHPFDGKKYSKAWGMLKQKIGSALNKMWVEPQQPVSDIGLLKVHQQQYLDSLSSSKTIASVIEIASMKYIPNFVLQNRFIQPVRFATAGTIEAAHVAIEGQCMAMNIGGGFHHAFPDHGEGFSFFADAALAIEQCRENHLLSKSDNIIMIDLDAHRGNGFQATYAQDPSVHMFDMYNCQVYPGAYSGNTQDNPFIIPLKAYTTTSEYLSKLNRELPEFLSSVADVKLALYNAGTDILDDDPLGALRVNFDGVLERDRYVLQALMKRRIPTVIMTSGGYSKRSYELVAQLAMQLHSCDPRAQ